MNSVSVWAKITLHQSVLNFLYSYPEIGVEVPIATTTVQYMALLTQAMKLWASA